ncbi:MAG: DUF2937 family protein [Parvularculaceae bacterium]
MAAFFARLMGVLGIVVGSQAPGFTIQYLQNLDGRVEELAAIVSRYDAIVDELGMTRDAYVDELRTSGQLASEKTADSIEYTFDRYEYLREHQVALTSAQAIVRPLRLARSVDAGVARSVRENFRWTVPLTPDAAAYAIGVGVVVWGALSFFFGLLGSMFGMGRR